MGTREDLSGQVFSRLTVLRESTPKTSPIKYECQCACGVITVARGSSLKNQNTRSCGCLAREELAIRATTHGARKTRLYQAHTSMMSRCYIPSSSSYSEYGWRGIRVCDEWHTFEAFRDWALANGYSDTLTLDRKETEGNYEPGNCRWTNQLTQVRNRRPFRNSSSKYIGVSWNKQYSKWTASVGLNYKVVHLGRYSDEVTAAKARDGYIIQNNLQDFVLNFP